MLVARSCEVLCGVAKCVTAVFGSERQGKVRNFHIHVQGSVGSGGVVSAPLMYGKARIS